MENVSLETDIYIAPIDSAQNARSVREETADLASYALSDRASARSISPPPRRQTQLESYFDPPADSDTASNRERGKLSHDTIPEVSEPVSPENGPSSHPPRSSILTDMIRRSPPSTSPPSGGEEQQDVRHPKSKGNDRREEEGRLIITTNGVEREPRFSSEQTPLIRKDATLETPHPDWIRGEQDIEGQTLKRKKSWPKIRNIMEWPKQKGASLTRRIFNKRAWTRQSIWENGVLAPAGFMPAVVLGLLLNVLDALSYGELEHVMHFWTTS